MDNTVTFYYNPMSRGRMVHWMLEEVGAPYEIKFLDFKKREHKDAKFLALNPMGKIPTIVHRGTVITETAAICAYLADAFPQAQLAPPVDSPLRGTYYRWLFFGAGCVEPAYIDKMLKRPVAPETGSLGYGSYDDTISTLETALKPGPFVLGQNFSTADVYLCSQIGWGMMTKTFEPRPAFQKYLQLCGERPAYKRFNAQIEAMAEKIK